MDCVADTVTIIRHFSGAGVLGTQAKNILNAVEQGKHHLYISIISLVEIMYLSQKNRIRINLSETLEIIKKSDNYSIVDLSPAIVQHAESVAFPELFDRLIIATAQFLGLPLVTSDKAIHNSRLVKTVWK